MEFYLEVMKKLRETEVNKRPEGWRNKTWMLQHDDAPAHTSILVSEFLAKYEKIVVPQTPYSPNLAPAEFFVFLFPRLKSTLKGRRFQTIENVEENSLRNLRAIPQTAFQDWKKVGSCV
jgi:transposase